MDTWRPDLGHQTHPRKARPNAWSQPRNWLHLIYGASVALLFLTIRRATAPVISVPHAIVIEPWTHEATRDRSPRNGLHGFRMDDVCNASSLEIHRPFSPLCRDRRALLEAMSNGGRLAYNLPYNCRGCDMEWFTTSEICSILSRFDHIYFIGDSLIRNIAQAMMVLIRGDLVDGGRATWRNDTIDTDDCHCRGVFHKGECIFWSAIDTEMVLENDPASILCPASEPLASTSWVSLLNYPLTQERLDELGTIFKSKIASGREVFVVDHGLWNGLEAETTMAWLEQLDDAMRRHMPAYFEPDLDPAMFPRLYLTPSAQGENKPEIYTFSQNNNQMLRHITTVKPFVQDLGYEHLGLYNLTVQATTPDGTHPSMENNLMKAMMVLNWLNLLDTPDYEYERISS